MLYSYVGKLNLKKVSNFDKKLKISQLKPEIVESWSFLEILTQFVELYGLFVIILAKICPVSL